MRSRLMLALAIAIAPSAAAAAPKAPKPVVGKAAPACGVRILPLVVGNTWTYSPITTPVPVDAGALAGAKGISAISPKQAKRVVITVQSIAPKGGDTIVTLDEKVTTEVPDSHDPTGKKMLDDTRALTTTITCNAKKFDISPESFFFAGEPGGSYAISFDNFDRKGTSWALSGGTIGAQTWREDVVARWSISTPPDSHAAARTGKLELERVFAPAPPEKVGTPLGVYQTEKLALTTTGRVTLDHPAPDTKPMEMPANWINQIWLAENVGVVQVLTSYTLPDGTNQEYQLTEASLK